MSFIFITCHDDAALERKALAIGAADFITKPIHADICLMRVNNQVILQQQADAVKLALVD